MNMADLEIPNFGALLGPAIGSVSDDARPGLLARLERGAADRYRQWAEAEPDVADELNACAGREDQIADSVDALFPLDPADVPLVEKAVPIARELYYAAFEGKPILDQWRIQASAERQGSMAWRGIASQIDDEAVCKALEDCAQLEEASADALDRLIADRTS
jgi:hypothetical protein